MSCNFCYTLLFNYNEHAYICSGEKDNIKPGVASSDTLQCNSQLCPAPALPQTSHLCRSPSPPYRAGTAEEQPSWGASAPGALIHQGWPGILGSRQGPAWLPLLPGAWTEDHEGWGSCDRLRCLSQAVDTASEVRAGVSLLCFPHL